jgi:hypothetical protein
MLLVWTHGESLAASVGIDERDGDKVGVRNGACIGHGERVFEDLLYWAPDVLWDVSKK